MFTTGFKLFFGLFAAFTVAAILYGYATGGDIVGPISLGWKGGVGDHIGYGILVALSGASLGLSLVVVSYRDADAEAQAHLLGVDEDELEPTNEVVGTFWPVVASFGAGTAVVGLVLHPVVFILGLALVALSLIEWTMDAWADRATGDPAVNRDLRNRIMAPIEIPVIGAISIGVIVLAASRIMLTVSKLNAVWVAAIVSTVILAGAVVYAYRPGTGRRLIRALGVLGALALLVAGVVSAAVGEREFHPHEPDAHHEEETHDEADASDASGGADHG